MVVRNNDHSDNTEELSERVKAERERKENDAARASSGANQGGFWGIFLALIESFTGISFNKEPDNYVEMSSQNSASLNKATFNIAEVTKPADFVSAVSQNEYIPLTAEDAIINKLLSTARAEVGVEEVGKNGGVDVARYMSPTGMENQGLPWCAGFMSYISECAMPGVINPTAGSLAMMRQTQEIGSFKAGDSGYQVQAGDFMYIDRKAAGDAFAHVAFVDEVRKDGTIITIEGNIGDKVVRREYSPEKLANSRLLGFSNTREAIQSQLSLASTIDFSEADLTVAQIPSDSVNTPNSTETVVR